MKSICIRIMPHVHCQRCRLKNATHEHVIGSGASGHAMRHTRLCAVYVVCVFRSAKRSASRYLVRTPIEFRRPEPRLGAAEQRKDNLRDARSEPNKFQMENQQMNIYIVFFIKKKKERKKEKERKRKSKIENCE